MKARLLLLVVVLATMAWAGCGSRSRSLASRTSAAAQAAAEAAAAEAAVASHGARTPHEYPLDADADNDNPVKTRYDGDDRPVLQFGQVASRTDTGAIVALVRRYYGFAVRHDGVNACRLLFSPVAEQITEDYGRPPGPSWMRGKKCDVVVSKFLSHNHKEMAASKETFKVTSVRVEGDRAVMLMSVRKSPLRRLLFHREDGEWKLEVLNDVGVP